ncbi:MAG: single-stranded DNA-binding protein [Bacilli bacterium]|nr:single-stranded DNA-binding protein [Bacilli bacterium]
MLNQTVIVGRLVDEPKLQETENGKKVTNLTIAVPRSFKNADGEYDTDFVDCVLWSGVAETTAEYCKKGDLVGIKGRIQTDTYENNEGKKQKSTKIIAEKVTFLSSKQKDNEHETEKKSSEKQKNKKSKERE